MHTPLPVILRAIVSVVAAHESFFIFYSEGGPHVRLRVKGDAVETVHAEVRAALTSFSDVRWVPAAYERENLRYGGVDHIGDAETVFISSSRLAASMWQSGQLEGRAARVPQALALMGAMYQAAGMSKAAAAACAVLQADSLLSVLYSRKDAQNLRELAESTQREHLETARRAIDAGCRFSRQGEAHPRLTELLDQGERRGLGRAPLVGPPADQVRVALLASLNRDQRLERLAELRLGDGAKALMP